ncbi:MAG: aldo/keto reductase [Actinomycetota bacterium]
MRQRYVGHSGLRVSRLALGTMTWGGDTDEHESRDQLTTFLDAGGTLIDTAAGYGDGAAERTIGTILGDVAHREDVILCTKAGVTRHGVQRTVDTSRGAMLTALDASLRRLGTDYVDMWFAHAWSDSAPMDETLSALDMAVRSGRARYVGISNYTGWQSAHAATWQRRDFTGSASPVVAHQVEYSLVNRHPDTEVVPAAQALGMGILAWSPLGRGVLTGKYRTGIPADSRAASPHLAPFVERYLNPHSRHIVDAVVTAAEGLGCPPAHVALAWVRDRPGVTAPVVGARTVAQLRELLGSEDITLPTQIAEVLTEVSEKRDQEKR